VHSRKKDYIDITKSRSRLRRAATAVSVLGMTIYMGGGPSLMYAADGISAFEEIQVQLGVAA